MRKVIVVLFLALSVVTAQAAQLGQINTDSTEVAVREIIHPLAAQSITQSNDPDTLVDGTSVACVGAVTTENGWFRLFDLDTDHGLVGTYTLESLDWGSQNVQGALNITLNAYCLDDGLPFLMQFLTLVGTAGPIPVADENLVFHNDAITGSCDSATQSLAMEIFAEDCNLVGCTVFFVGMNDLGQTGASYVASASCGLIDPVDLAGLGFPNAHLVMVVNGQDGGTGDDGGVPDDGGDVPATTGIGLVLMILALGGGSAYFLRRK